MLKITLLCRVNPRYLTESTGTIFCSLMWKLRCFVTFIFLDLKITIFVFPVFRDRINWTTNFRSLLICLLSSFNEFSVSKRFVLSAKWCTMEQSTALWKSLIKRIGPNINPCGTPILTSLSEDLVLLIVVCYFLPSMNDLSHLFDLSRIP